MMALSNSENNFSDSGLDQLKDMNQNRDIRNLRNLAEKQRRDKLNGYINELATTVPLVTMSSKRLDKTSVLRLSAAYLRINKTALRLRKQKSKKSGSAPMWRPPKFRFDDLRSLMDSVEGFIVVTTGFGKIIYVSHSVENFLGHQNIEMIGHSLTSFLHPNDIELVERQIHSAHQQVSKGSQTSDKLSFQCRLREKNQPRSEVITYQMVEVSGYISNTYNSKDSDEDISSTTDVEDKCENNILFKGFVQIIPTNPMAELNLMDADLDEYVSRHSLDGTLIFADHRIAGIIGFLPSEVVGNSAYSYILPDDHSIALFAHKLMLSNSNGTGTIVHRLRTSSGSFVFLQSSGCLQYDKVGQIDHWVCVSRLLVENEGDKERDKFVKRFTPHIFNISPTALYESLQIVIGPRNSGSKSDSIKIKEIESPRPLPPPIQTDSLVTLTSPIPVTNSSDMEVDCVTSTANQKQTHLLQPKPRRQLSPKLVSNSTQTPSTDLTVPNVQSSPIVQIQTLPIFALNSTQVLTPQMSDSFNQNNISKTNQLSLNRSDSFSHNIINLIAPSHVTPVSISYINSNTNNSNQRSEVINSCDDRLSSTVGNVNFASKPSNSLMHLLGATVLTYDTNQRPVLSVYSPSIASEENSKKLNNLTDNKRKLKFSETSDTISPTFDASFYSPNNLNSEDSPIKTQSERLTLNGLNFDELSNHSTNSLLSFSFPSNDSQCDFGLIEDQSLDPESLLDDPFLSTGASNGGKGRIGFVANEVQLDPTVETEITIFDVQNPETNSSTFVTSKTNTN